MSDSASATTTTANTVTVDVDQLNDTPESKKLKLLANMDDKHSTASLASLPTESSDNHHQLILEISAYLGPLKLTNEELLSPLAFWKRYTNTYPRLSRLARVYLTPNASSVPVESRFSITGIIKNA